MGLVEVPRSRKTNRILSRAAKTIVRVAEELFHGGRKGPEVVGKKEQDQLSATWPFPDSCHRGAQWFT